MIEKPGIDLRALAIAMPIAIGLWSIIIYGAYVIWTTIPRSMVP